MSSKPKLLWCSQSPALTTGYGVTSNETLGYLQATGKFDILCHAWYEPPKPQPAYPFESANSNLFKFKMLHCGVDQKTLSSQEPSSLDMRNGKANFKAIIETYKPDITVFFADIYMFKWLLNEEARKKTHLIGYFPIDSIPVDPSWHATIKDLDTAVTLSRFGQNMVEKILKTPTPFIYHAVEYGYWSKPLSRGAIKEAKQQMFGKDDVFVFGMVARNQPRKNIPAFFEAFYHHSKTNPNSRILMHASDIDKGWRLRDLAREFGIADKVLITNDNYMQDGHKGIGREELKLLYSCMDVHINTAWGEGFGKPIIESMACGVPNFITDYSVCKEFLEDGGGEPIKVAAFVTEPMTHARHAYIAPSHLSQLMTMATSNKRWVQEAGEKAKRTAAKMDWTQIGPQWDRLLGNIVSNLGKTSRHLAVREF